MLIVQDADLVSAITDPNKRVVDMSARTAGNGKGGVLSSPTVLKEDWIESMYTVPNDIFKGFT